MKTVKHNSEVFGTIYVDAERIMVIRSRLADGYRTKNKQLILKAAEDAQRYVDEGLDDTESYCEAIDDYAGTEPKMLARQYITRVFLDRYLDDDNDQYYIRTGLKPFMRKWNSEPIQLSLF